MVGNAFCLDEDYRAAKKLFPSAPCIAVNGAAREVKALALFSCHPERFVEKGCEWIRHQQRLFGDDFSVHGSKYLPAMPWVAHWWPDARGAGGSAWGARKLAWLMGFEPVILVGCPLLPGNYAGHKPGALMTRSDVVAQYASEIASDKDWHEGAYSMSGATKDILGFPC